MSGGDKKKADKKDKKPAQQKKETPKKKEEKKDDKPAEPAADAPVRVCLVSHNDPTASSCLPYPLFVSLVATISSELVRHGCMPLPLPHGQICCLI